MPNDTKTIYHQLFALQNEIGAISKTETNPFFKSKYFDINGLLEQLKPLLEKHNLVVIQPLSHIEGKPAIETTVLSTLNDGQITRTMPLSENTDPQKMGSAISYFRRYALQSLFLLQAEDDDAQSTTPVYNHPPIKSVRNTYTVPDTTSTVHTCRICGAPEIRNPKTNKLFCRDKCWLKKPHQPAIQVDGYSQDEYPPPPFEG